MDIIKVYIKYLAWVLVGIIGAIFLYGIIALTGSVIPVKAKETTPDNPVEIYIWGNGVHTDLVLPVRSAQVDWKEVFAKDDPEITYAFRYVAIGWGNKDFYLNTPTWADLSVRTALQAVTGLGDSVYHLSWYKSMYEDEDSRKLTLSATQYEQLIEYIISYLKKDEEGQPIPVKSTIEYGRYHRFYEAKGHYSMFFTCNTFTNSALKKSGQRACLWTPFEQGIFYQLKYPDIGRTYHSGGRKYGKILYNPEKRNQIGISGCNNGIADRNI